MDFICLHCGYLPSIICLYMEDTTGNRSMCCFSPRHLNLYNKAHKHDTSHRMYIFLIAAKMACFISYLQSPVQAVLRPAMWLPFIKRLHSHKERLPWLLMYCIFFSNLTCTCICDLLRSVKIICYLVPTSQILC